jgi:choline transport protein
MSVLSWQSNSAAAGFITASIIQTLAYVNDPGDSDTSDWAIRWQGTLLSIGTLLGVAAANIWAAKLLAPTQILLLFLHTVGFIVLIALLWALGDHVPASQVFGNFENMGGWSSIGLSLMVGQISAAFALISSDAAAHLSEEVKDAGLTVPRSMWWSFVLNAAMGLLFIITFLFAMPNVSDALNYPGFAFFYVLTKAMPTSGVNALAIIGIFLLVGGNININASTSRQTFAFARDKGLPFSSWISKVSFNIILKQNPEYYY